MEELNELKADIKPIDSVLKTQTIIDDKHAWRSMN